MLSSLPLQRGLNLNQHLILLMNQLIGVLDLEGRPSPNISDIESLALPILRHRVLPNFNAESDGLKVDDIINNLLDHLRVK